MIFVVFLTGNKHANCEEVQSKLDELYKLENYLKNMKGISPSVCQIQFQIVMGLAMGFKLK